MYRSCILRTYFRFYGLVKDICTGRHRVFIPRAHLVFVTRYRVFAARHLDCMEQIMRDVRADFGTELVEFNGEPERVHLPVQFRPRSRLAGSLKGVSSRQAAA